MSSTNAGTRNSLPSSLNHYSHFILTAANDSLQILDLSWNYIRLKGGISIAKGLKVRTKLNQSLFIVILAKLLGNSIEVNRKKK